MSVLHVTADESFQEVSQGT